MLNNFTITPIDLGYIQEIKGLKQYSDEVVIVFEYGSIKFYHEQDCCENVQLVDFENDIKLDRFTLLIGIDCTSGNNEESPESGTWTFYEIKTSTGSLWLRWLGESNGYYSESVSIEINSTIYIHEFEDY